MAARLGPLGLRRGLTEAGQLHAIGPLRLGQCIGQRFAAHRLEQVADSTHGKGVERVLAVRGAEHHGRRFGVLTELGGGLQAVQPGHANVQQQDIGMMRLNQLQGLVPIAGHLGQRPVPRQRTNQSRQPLAGQRLIISDQYFHSIMTSLPLLNLV